MLDDQDVTRRSFVGGIGATIVASSLPLISATAHAKPPTRADIAALEKTLGRSVVTPANTDDYDAARAIWNGLFDRKPAVIAACRTAQDVAACLQFARAHALPLSIRSGGHHGAGVAVNDNGLVIDLSEMNGIVVDKDRKRVVVGPGARVGELCMATEAAGLVVPTAANATVGLGGMTTGGGDGWFGEYGLTVDNLLSAEIVMADGRIARIDAANEPDLFWAIRGGGGNFCVATSFELQAHPLPPLMLGVQVYPLEQSQQVALKWQDYILSASTDIAGSFQLSPKAMTILSKFARPEKDARAEFTNFPVWGSAQKSEINPISLTELQNIGTIGSDAGLRYFQYSHYVERLSPELLDACLRAVRSSPSEGASILVIAENAEVAKVPVDATAFPHRGPRFALLARIRWEEKTKDQRNIDWIKKWWASILPYATGEIWNNYVSETTVDVSRRAYGPNLPRLSSIKRRYDPDNVFNSAVSIPMT